MPMFQISFFIQKRFVFEWSAKSFTATTLFFFLTLFLLAVISVWTCRSFSGNLRQLFLQTCVTKIGSPSLGTLANYYYRRLEISCA